MERNLEKMEDILTIKDRIYGNKEIGDPLALEIINSNSFQRLKGIDQAGWPPLWEKENFPMGKFDHSRFAHSIGVYSLLGDFGASREEKIAGLVHDVSHSAFSHTIDYVLKQGSPEKQSHQDSFHEEYISKTDIPKILKKYGIDLGYILDDSNFPLKEKDLPDLCADRIDYSLRTAVLFDEINQKEAQEILSSLKIINNKWIFLDYQSARKYAELFEKLNRVYYSGFSTAIMFQAVADYLKCALDKKYIQESDLYLTDKEVVEKINNNLREDKILKKLWMRMSDKKYFENNPDDFDVEVICKSRAVDPLCLDKNAIKRVSEINTGWLEVISRESKPKRHYLKYKI
jgi:uncharacterized protein